MYEVQGTLTCPPTPPHPTPPHNRDIQKRAFYGNGFRSAGINMYKPSSMGKLLVGFITGFDGINHGLQDGNPWTILDGPKKGASRPLAEVILEASVQRQTLLEMCL